MRKDGSIQTKVNNWRVTEYNDADKIKIRQTQDFTTAAMLNKEYPDITPRRLCDFLRGKCGRCGKSKNIFNKLTVEKIKLKN